MSLQGGNLKSENIGLLHSNLHSRSHEFFLNIQDALIYGGIFIIFAIFLDRLIKYAKYKLDLPNYTLKMEDFYKENGYTYEFVFVFAVLTIEEKEKLTPYQLKFSMKRIIDRLQNAGLETKLFYSCQRDEIYVKVRTSYERLLDQADLINYKLLLDPNKLRTRLNAGKRRGDDDDNDLNDGYIWKPIIIEDEFGVSDIEPYEFIYGDYRIREDLQSLYKTYPTPLGNELILRQVDRIKLLISIMEGDITTTPPGAGLKLSELELNKAVLAGFPIHDYDALEALQLEWLGLNKYKLPLDEINNYFGERIGLYFTYLQHHTHSLYYPAIGGLITFAAQIFQETQQGTIQPWYTLLMVIWNTVFIEKFKQRQSTTAMEWGTEGFESAETTRPQYEGVKVRSPVDNKMTIYFPPNQKQNRQVIVYSIVLLVLLVVIGLVGAIFAIQELVFGVSKSVQTAIVIQGFDGVVFLTAVAQAVLIHILDVAFQQIMIPLNDYENHRTQTDYEDYLVLKVFLFKIVNNYSALMYLAFMKEFVSAYRCRNNSCVNDLTDTLRVIFLIDLLLRSFNEVVVRLIKQTIKNKAESQGVEPGKSASIVEQQYVLAEYDVLLDTIKDYGSLMTQYGYMILFVAVFPIGPTLAFAAGFIQVRVDAWKLCQATRRPIPQTVEDIGYWMDMLEIVSVLAVLFNMALLAFITDYLVEYTWMTRWVIFIIGEHLLLVVKFVLSIYIEDVTEEVEMQIERKHFITSKIIEDEEDEIDPEYKPNGFLKPIYIADTDKEWFYPGQEEATVAMELKADEESKIADGANIEMKNIYKST